jgi:hypothetical protein
MSDRIEEQPYDERHNTPPAVDHDATGLNRSAMGRVQELADVAPEHQAPGTVFWTQGDHIGNDHQEGVREEMAFQPVERFRAPEEMPRRPLIHPHVAEHGIPSFGTGLTWQASVQSPRVEDLASVDWLTMERMPNVELHTIFAHLMVASEAIRSEMRRRGMRVDL